MRLKSDLGRARGLGSAKEGPANWWAERLTSIALVPLTLWFIYAAVSLSGAGYEAYVQWIKGPGTVTLLVLLLGFMFYHLALGLQVIVEDYVHGEAAKVTSIIVIKLGAVFLCVSGIVSVFQVAFGG